MTIDGCELQWANSTLVKNITRKQRQFVHRNVFNKKLSYCWETVRRESMPKIAELGVEITT